MLGIVTLISYLSNLLTLSLDDLPFDLSRGLFCCFFFIFLFSLDHSLLVFDPGMWLDNDNASIYVTSKADVNNFVILTREFDKLSNLIDFFNQFIYISDGEVITKTFKEGMNLYLPIYAPNIGSSAGNYERHHL